MIEIGKNRDLTKKKKMDNTIHWIELYMMPSDTFANDVGIFNDIDSNFILKVDDKSFKVTANYILDFRRCTVLKSFFFEEKLYPVGTFAESITIH